MRRGQRGGTTIVSVLSVQLATPAMVGRRNCVAMGTTRDGALTKMLQGLTAAKCAVRALQGKCGTAAVMALPDTASFALQDLTKFRLFDATHVLLVDIMPAAIIKRWVYNVMAH